MPAANLTETPASRGGWPAWWIAAALFAGACFLYWPAVHHDFVNYDDDLYVYDNYHVETGLTWENVKWAFAALMMGNWSPVTLLSHILDCQIYGLRPWGHHLTSLVLHALNTALVFLWLNRLTGARWRSAFVAALFGCHPINVESVAWVAERKNVLSVFFGLLALLCYTGYAQARRLQASGEDPSASRAHSSLAFWLAFVCLAVGLMAKSMLVTWPVLMLLLDYWPLGRWQRGRWLPLIWEKAPFFALSLALCVSTPLEHLYIKGSDVQSFASLPLGARAGNALVSYCRYLGKLVWPVDLAVFYPHPGYWPLWEALLAGFALAGLTLACWAGRKRFPFLLVGWFWYGAGLLPVIGFIQVGFQSMADRHAYTPELGIFLAAAWGGAAMIQRRAGLAAPLAAVAVAVLLFECAAARRQLACWQNSRTLFEHALAVTQGNYIAHYNLGIAYEREGALEPAIAQLRAAVRIEPIGAAYGGLGCALDKAGRTDEALTNLLQAVRLAPSLAIWRQSLAAVWLEKGQTNSAFQEYQEALRLEPGNASVHYNYGVALLGVGQADAAAAQFQEAIAHDPDSPGARRNLGNLLGRAGQVEAAIQQYQAVLRLHPDDADTRYLLGLSYCAQGRLDAAVPEFQADLKLQPADADAHYQLARALAELGRETEAVAEFHAAFKLKHFDPTSAYNLGNSLAKQGRAAAAICLYEETVRLKPDDADARNNLGNLLLKQGRVDDAIAELREAVRMKPADAAAHYNLAVALNHQGQAANAISEYRAAIRWQPDFAPAHNSLGILLAAQGNLNDAISQFREAVRLKPNYPAAQTNLAKALELKGQAP